MNGFGKNLDRSLPDMLEYWNFALSNEISVMTRQKYTWLDNCAFIGGNVDFVFMIVGIFFFIYNYKISEFNLYYQHHKIRAINFGKDDN